MNTIETGSSRAAGDLAGLTVSSAMHVGVLTCSREAPLRDVASIMAAHRVHCVVACDDEDGRGLWGVVSDLDLVETASASGIEGRTAGETAATPVVTVAPGETLERAAQLMAEHALAHLVVVDPVSGDPAGILSTLDIARVLARPGR